MANNFKHILSLVDERVERGGTQDTWYGGMLGMPINALRAMLGLIRILSILFGVPRLPQTRDVAELRKFNP